MWLFYRNVMWRSGEGERGSDHPAHPLGKYLNIAANTYFYRINTKAKL